MRVRRIWQAAALIGMACVAMVLRWEVAQAQATSAGATEAIEVSFGYGPHPPLVGDAVSFVNLTDAPNGGVYEWDFGDGFESTERHPTHVFEERGAHEVVLSVCDADRSSCGEYLSTIWVQSATRQRRAMTSGFTVSSPSPQAGETVSLIADRGRQTSLWRVPELDIASDVPGAASIDVVFPAAGSYVVEHLTCWPSSGSMRCDRTERTIDVTEAPSAEPATTSPGADAADPSEGPRPPSAQLSVRVAPANVRYDGFLGAPASLRWTDTNTEERGYRVYATRNDFVSSEIGLRVEVPTDSTEAQFPEFSSAYAVVCYEVKAVFADDTEGPASPEICHLPPGRITSATDVEVTPGAAIGSADVRWTAEVSNTLRFWLCTSAATHTSAVDVSRDDFIWEIVDGASITRGYEHTLYGLPTGERVTVEIHPDPINGGWCLGTGVGDTTTLPESAKQ